MITLINRKELLVTFDINRLAEIRNVLGQYNIDYQIKTVNRTEAIPMVAGIRGQIGRVGERQDLMCEYIVYVQKKDYEKALHLCHEN